jgi:hypothetical protein
MQLVDGSEISSQDLTYLAPGEVPTFGVWLHNALVNGKDWRIPLLLLTNCRFIISRERMIGKPRADLALAWADVSTIGSGSITPSMIELIVTTTAGPLPIITPAQYAAEIEGAIRSGYLSNPNHPAHRRLLRAGIWFPS